MVLAQLVCKLLANNNEVVIMVELSSRSTPATGLAVPLDADDLLPVWPALPLFPRLAKR
jgi:hypothetical protein